MMNVLKQKVRAYERLLIEEAVRSTGGQITSAAVAFGIPVKTLYHKLAEWRIEGHAPDDEPLAWAIRRDGDRVKLGACWTPDEIAADLAAPTTLAVLRDVGPMERGSGRARAEFTVRDMNTAIAVRAALPPVVIDEEVPYVY